MAGTDYDVIIGSFKAKVIRTAERGGYTRRFVRREIDQNLVSQSAATVLQSRSDRPSLYQTSWAGGATWWKPLLNTEFLSTYFRSNHFDLWSEPGKVVPMNAVVDAANTSIHDNCVIAVGASGQVYAVGATTTEDATNLDVYVWTPASNAFVRDPGLTSGVVAAASPVAMVYDPLDGYFYVLANDHDLERFNPATNAFNANWIITGFTIYPGANIFLQNQNLMFYDGEKIYTVTKGTPAVVARFNDGMGPDFLSGANYASTNLFRVQRLAVSTPEGIFYVKNTRQGEQPVAWVFRVEKDIAGNWIGNPITNLPVGTIALSIAEHLGQLIITTTPAWQETITNSTDEAEIVLYFVGEGGMGVLGSILGGREELDETPYTLLGSSGPNLYLGGHKRLWVYDSIRGGLHSMFAWDTAVEDGGYVAMAHVENSSGNATMIFLGQDRIARLVANRVNSPDTVVAFGDDETYYTLESNYFDFGLPMEVKELTKAEILRQKDDGGSEWTVQVSTDDSAFADVLTDSGTTGYGSAELSGTTGRRFRYKLIYQTKDTARKALESLKLSATTGELVQEWELVLDGAELLNVDNEVQDEQTFYDNMKTLGETEATTTLIDNMQEQEQESDAAGTGIQVKVMAVEINKGKPGESLVTVVLRED